MSPNPAATDAAQCLSLLLVDAPLHSNCVDLSLLLQPGLSPLSVHDLATKAVAT